MPITGVDQTIRNLVSLSRTLPAETDAFLHDEADGILADSEPLVPRDTDELFDSRKVSHTGGNLAAGFGFAIQPRNELGQFMRGGWQVSYGKDGAVDYALTVHEHPSEHDPPSWQGKTVHFTTGGPKFLERPFRARAATVFTRLAAHLRRLVGP